MEDVTSVFEKMHLTDDDRYTVATLLLERAAKTWWRKIERSATTPLTWGDFQTAFDTQYYTPYQQDRKRKQFLQTSQRGRLVADYEAEFSELAAFVPELIPSERYLCTRFIEGLDLDIRERLARRAQMSSRKWWSKHRE